MRSTHYTVHPYCEPLCPEFHYAVRGPAFLTDEDTQQTILYGYDACWPCETLSQANRVLLDCEEMYQETH